MNITPLNINLKPQTIKNFSAVQRFVRGMESRGLAPLIMLECCVTGGRTIQAFKRGGFDEGRERLTEESIGAAFWFAGVKVFNKINDYILKHLMGFKNTNFDAQGDSIRKPLANYMKWAKDSGQNIPLSKIASFKFTKIAASILLANGLVGFVVPKMNQSITRYYHRNDKKFNPQVNFEEFRTMGYNPQFGMEQFIDDAQALEGKKKKNKKPSFGNGAQTLLNLSHKFEHDTIYQLLSTDIGISGGRAISARNNHERVEILWRDISSIFFYMFSMPLINKLMNKIEHGTPSRLNPVGARQVTDYMKYALELTGHNDKTSGKLSIKPKEFAQIMLGDVDVSAKMNKVKSEFKDGAITLDKFLEILKQQFSPEDAEKYSNLAKRMSKLQPQLEGVSMLAESQAEAIFKGGALNNPEFWDNVFTVEKGVEKQTKVINGVRTTVTTANHKNPFKFVAQKELDGLIENVRTYVKTIVKNAEKSNGDITLKTLENAYKNNIFKNTLNWGTGFVVSALFLSTIIPKIQYLITRLTTGSNAFPGTADYSSGKKN